MTEPRHEFYETGERVTISIFDKGVSPDDVSVSFSARSLRYEHGDKSLILDPLTGEIDPDTSSFTIGKVKVEVRLTKKSAERWVRLVGGTTQASQSSSTSTSASASMAPPPPARKKNKNWETIAEDAIKSDAADNKSDPNVGEDAASSFFQKIFADADDDVKRAMMKSYQESGGTTLSTNWEDVRKKTVDVKPPEGSEWRKWG